jgi:hypothetical protein
MSIEGKKIICRHCNAVLPKNHKGPCPSCGKTGSKILISIKDTLYVSSSSSWEKRREFVKTQPVTHIIIIIISLAAPFLGLIISGWIGVIIGILIAVLLYILGPKALMKIREIERGKSE